MLQTDPETQSARQSFEYRISPEGRFASYARGRLAHFASRQVLTVLGSLILGAMIDPGMGILVFGIALIGEGIDCLTLRRFLVRGMLGARARMISTITAALQAVAITMCVWIGWHATIGPEARFFAIAYICGAVINAGLVYPFHRHATEARIVIYILAIATLFAIDGVAGRGGRTQLVFDSLATLMLSYMAYSFVQFVLRSHTKRIKMEGDLIEQQDKLDHSYQTLRTREREAQHLALVAANANDSVLVTDREGRIEYTNASFTRVTGYTPEEALGRLPADLLNGPNTDKEAISAILNAREEHAPVRMELINRTKSGKDIWVETNITPLIDADGVVQGEVAIERDITRSKQRELELAAAKTAAEEGARAKAQFLAMVSHEIRTPLNGIIGMSDVMLSGSLEPEQRNTVETILASGESLLTIINDILDLSKLEAGKMEVESTPFNLRTQLQGALTLLHPLALDKGLSISLEFDGMPEGDILGDPGRVRQVFLNLMGNAIKFTQAGGVIAKVVALPSEAPTEIRISVQDTGIGIAEERLSDVFAAFAQADSATTRHFGGTGLGLTISRQLAHQMGGDITATSTPGVGSCFTMSFGTRVVAATERAGQVATPTQPLQLPSELRILVADDNRTNQLLLSKLLSDLEGGLMFADDGLEAVAAFTREAPDLVLMDMSMPRCDGLEATRRIRALEAGLQSKSVPIIALTANAFASDRDRCLAAGMDGFLTKPIRRRELFDAILSFAPDTIQDPHADPIRKAAAI